MWLVDGQGGNSITIIGEVQTNDLSSSLFDITPQILRPTTAALQAIVAFFQHVVSWGVAVRDVFVSRNANGPFLFHPFHPVPSQRYST